MSTYPIPTEVTLHRQSRCLELAYGKDSYRLGAEYLRVSSPSAEVKGHGQGQETLQVGKENVAIDQIQAVGHYALKIFFSDGHDSGLFTWDYLYQLATEYEARWQRYLEQLQHAGYQRQQ
jgi:DUF971 family protein